MNPNILKIVRDVAGLSAGARSIADRVIAAASDTVENSAAVAATQNAAVAASLVDTENPQATIAALRAQVATLQKRVEELSEALEAATDVDMTDVEMRDAQREFVARLNDTPSSQLIGAYDYEFFKAQPRTMRRLIASALCEIFDNRRVPPIQLWERFSTNGGGM